MLAIIVIIPARLLPICTRDLTTLVNIEAKPSLTTVSCPIHVHQPLPMFVMFYSYSSVAQTTPRLTSRRALDTHGAVDVQVSFGRRAGEYFMCAAHEIYNVIPR